MVPWLVTALIFALIFRRVPFGQVWSALTEVRIVPYFAIMLPYSAFYLAVDTFCVSRVLNWFNCRIAYGDVLPIRATTYLLTLLNSSLGQGGIALYVHRREGVALLEVASSVLFMMFVELYQLVFYSSLGVALSGQKLDLPLAPIYLALYAYLVVHLSIFRFAGDWVGRLPAAGMLRSFRLAGLRHYVLLLLFKSPNFLMATIVYYLALQCFGMRLPYLDLVLYLPLIFLSASLPIGAARLGAPQLLWIYFFGRQAPAASLLAFSLATHFTFITLNAALGLPFLPRASYELTRGSTRRP